MSATMRAETDDYGELEGAEVLWAEHTAGYLVVHFKSGHSLYADAPTLYRYEVGARAPFRVQS